MASLDGRSLRGYKQNAGAIAEGTITKDKMVFIYQWQLAFFSWGVVYAAMWSI